VLWLCSLRIFHAISMSLPATIMSKLSAATLRSYILTNSARSISQGSMPFSSTRLKTERIDSSTGSCRRSPDPAWARMSMYPPIFS